MQRPSSSLLVTWALLLVARAVACPLGPPGAPTGRSPRALTATRGGEASPARYLRQLSARPARRAADARGVPPGDRGGRGATRWSTRCSATRVSSGACGRGTATCLAQHGGLSSSTSARSSSRCPAAAATSRPRTSTPEWLVQAMDRRTAEPACPAAGTREHLTAASCCTASNPDHPALLPVRNAAYNPTTGLRRQVRCAARRLQLRRRRGRSVPPRRPDPYAGCDNDIEYLPPRVAAADRRWAHDADGPPLLRVAAHGMRRYYYDDARSRPYDDAYHCP